ncbi:hypothetical protein M948_13985 [Virgibacillus sp. CM-4]|uniref:DUF2515 family protein n=1 Tax=Virgibacillus sp. CM-4 TaxID=1354277 RepID=UPI000388512D|nr:DUF2515 family protein [Virgibacillus sp. CM-4]EQB36142.1 hypothetical protein M948_13985 [Virgibacillus sp. CM-4]
MYDDQVLQHYIHYITNLTKTHNVDNITRTDAYFTFYLQFPEIKWSFLASLVSRNAGYNMTDLYLPPFQLMLGEQERERLFMTYERANWLIFSDAYPQLLVYRLSLQLNQPLFHLLPYFHVSSFMVKEWNYFWKTADTNRIMIALIINEQNVIEQPVIRQSFFKKRVFHQAPYFLQNLLTMNAVLLPTKSAQLYGAFVHQFTSLTKRIELGKQLASILYSPSTFKQIFAFARQCEHTGSRYDYERFLNLPYPASPFLRMVYPVISHQDKIRKDWYKWGGIKKKWWNSEERNGCNWIGKEFYKKRSLIFAYYYVKRVFKG